MRFIKDNLLLFTLFVIVGVATLDSKNVIAGGDPNVKDSKVTKSKSNIKQHDHNKTYVDKQKKLSSTNKICTFKITRIYFPFQMLKTLGSSVWS